MDPTATRRSKDRELDVSFAECFGRTVENQFTEMTAIVQSFVNGAEYHA